MIGAAAREEITGRYSFERMVQGFEDLYDSQLRVSGAVIRPGIASRAA